MTDEMRNMLDAFGVEIKEDLNASDEEITNCCGIFKQRRGR